MKRGMKTSLLYLLLVGLPVIALIGVVRIGQQITPPPYVGGLWRAAEATLAQDACNPPGFTASLPEVNVNQSGQVLELSFPNAASAKSRAEMDEGALRATTASADPECPASWLLEARFGGTEYDRLEGRWTPVGCQACRPRTFIAVRASEVASADHARR